MRTDAAHTLKGVVTWLPQDIDSTPPTGFDLSPPRPSGCTSSPGTNLLRLEWTEVVSGHDHPLRRQLPLVLGYEHRLILRVSCSGTGAGPLGNTT